MPITIEEKNLLRLLARCLDELDDVREMVYPSRHQNLDELIGQVRMTIILAKRQVSSKQPTNPENDKHVEGGEHA